MKILALLIGLFIAHQQPGVAAWRAVDWMPAAARLGTGKGYDWLPAVTLVALSLLIGGVLTALAVALAGDFGALLIGLAAILYTMGPRDLDRDLAAAVDERDLVRREVAMERLIVQPADDGIHASAAVLHAALARWFGVIFWFIVLGLPGALVYRGVREAFHRAELNLGERHVLGRCLAWLNWPVMLLLTGAIGLMSDFDRVRATFAARADRWQFPSALLDDLAAALGSGEVSLAEGLDHGRGLAWRALKLWLVVLSLLLLAGWIY